MQDHQYIQFREEYERQHPASVPRYEPAMIGEYPGWVHYIVLAMFVSAAILSGVHTVPTVYDTIEFGKVSEIVRQVAALLSFVAVESSTLLASYMLFKMWSWIVASVLGIAMIVATVANLYSVGLALQASDAGLKIVAVTLGLGMPFLTVLAGKLYVNLHTADRRADFQAREKYRLDCIEFDRKVQSAYTRAGNGSGVKFNKNNMRNKPSPRYERALAWLQEHPEHVNTPPRDVATRIGEISYGTVFKAQQELKRLAVRNGHADE